MTTPKTTAADQPDLLRFPVALTEGVMARAADLEAQHPGYSSFIGRGTVTLVRDVVGIPPCPPWCARAAIGHEFDTLEDDGVLSRCHEYPLPEVEHGWVDAWEYRRSPDGHLTLDRPQIKIETVFPGEDGALTAEAAIGWGNALLALGQALAEAEAWEA